MALFLTILSVVLCYLSPADILPTLSAFHIQQFILGAAAVTSVFVIISNSGALRMWQTFLMVGFWFAIPFSLLVRGYMRGSMGAFWEFAPVIIIYFLIVVNAFSVPRVRSLCRALALCAVVMALNGIVAYATGLQSDDLFIDKRLRAYGILHDPNDYAQFLLVAMALLGLFWRRYNPLMNLLLVILPSTLLLFAIYLTGSRGAIFGLGAMTFAFASGKLGRGKALVIAVVVFAVMVSANFGAGRDISLHEGSAVGRIVAWGSGIAQLKSEPLFGVGYNQFTEYNDLTAHNSFVLCFAELGFFGYFFWIALFVTVMAGLEKLIKTPAKTPDDVEYKHCVAVLRAALYAQLATSWFLSRTYGILLYVLLAAATVLIALKRDQLPSPVLPLRSWAPATLVLTVSSVLLIYVTIRARAF